MTMQSLLARIARHKELSPLIILVLISIGFSIGNPNFFSPQNISNLLAFLPEIGIIALGMTLLLTAGEFDLSVGAVFALVPITVLLLVNTAGVPLELAVVASLGLAIVIGLVNGFLVTKEAITSFLVTLSMLLVVRGVSLLITNGFPQKPLEGEYWLVNLLTGRIRVGPFSFHATLFWFIGLAALLPFPSVAVALRQLDRRYRQQQIRCRCTRGTYRPSQDHPVWHGVIPGRICRLC